MDEIISIIQNFLSDVFVHPQIVIVLIAILPIVEARLAIPMAFGYGLPWYECWLWGFLGSSVIAPLLLLILIPFIKWLSTTKLFKRIGDALYSKFEDKSKQIDEKASNAKKFWGLVFFVGIPLPLTGAWTGCAVASILKMKYSHALGAVILGNFIASSIMTLLCAFLPQTVINYIITAIGIIALIVVVVLIVKIATYKKKTQTEENIQENNEVR
ncbi:MAG: small multi-drug export protein [Clostridia bacterium]|nr:small multi-drug export protein [Clostridia bacterium]